MAASRGSLDEMRDYIWNFTLDGLPHGNQGYQRVLLQLVGLIGSGKSALINSCKRVLDDREFIMYAKATNDPDAVTSHRMEYKLTPAISIVDNRPICRLDGQEMAEMYAQLGNFRPLNRSVNKSWTFYDFMSSLQEADRNPNYTDLIVPVFVYHGRLNICCLEEDHIQTFLRHGRLMTGFTPIVVITHKENIGTSELEKKFRALGAEQVISVENYTIEHPERVRCMETDRDILTFLYNALQEVTIYLGDKRKQRVKRKNFLLKYIHDVEVEKKAVQAERARQLHEKLKKKRESLQQ